VLAGLARSAGEGEEQAGTIFRAMFKMDKIGPEGVRREMVRNGVEDEVAGRVLDLFLRCWGLKSFSDNMVLLAELTGPLAGDEAALKGLEDLRSILAGLEGMGVQKDRFKVDVTLARGLDYYTGAVYEIVVDEPKIGSLGGGGRYDNLVGMFAGRSLPTTGASFGVERIIDVMEELGMVVPQSTPSKALVTVFDAKQESVQASLGLARELRERGVACEVYLNVGDKLGKQFGYADKLGIPFAIVLGPDEIEGGTATVKNLKAQAPGNQKTVERGGLASILLGEVEW
jgi:histidyl-tRNA synthetase